MVFMPLISNAPANISSGVTVPGSGISQDYLPYFNVGGAVIGQTPGLTIAGLQTANKAYSQLKPWNEVVDIYTNQNVQQALAQGYVKESPNTLTKDMGGGKFSVIKIDPLTGNATQSQREVQQSMVDSKSQAAASALAALVTQYQAAQYQGKDTTQLESKIAGLGNQLYGTNGVPFTAFLNASMPSINSAQNVTETITGTSKLDKDNFVSNAMSKIVPDNGSQLQKSFSTNNLYGTSGLRSMMPVTSNTRTVITSAMSPAKNQRNDMTGMAAFGFSKSDSGQSTRSSTNPFQGFSSNNPLLNVNSKLPTSSANFTDTSAGVNKMTQGFSSANPFLNTSGNTSPFANIINSDTGKSRKILKSSGSFADKLKMFGVRV